MAKAGRAARAYRFRNHNFSAILNERRGTASFPLLVTRSFWEVHSLQFKSARALGIKSRRPYCFQKSNGVGRDHRAGSQAIGRPHLVKNLILFASGLMGGTLVEW
ncbi:MAG TPA: hypothetical protein VGE76_01575 [Opitutaceae bacterium]